MRIHFCAVVLSGLLLAAPLMRAQQIQILMTGGPFRQGEVLAQSGETWYGLYAEGDKYHLEKTTIQVTPIHDHIVGDKEDEKSGLQVSCDRPHKLIFLVRGVEGLEEREVQAFYRGAWFFVPGDTGYFGQANNKLSVTALGNLHLSEPKINPHFQDYSLQFQAGDKKGCQLLAKYQAVDATDGFPCLIWVGDLDNDTRLDMFWDMTYNPNVRKYTLFLSSLAKDNQYVDKAAEFVHSLD